MTLERIGCAAVVLLFAGSVVGTQGTARLTDKEVKELIDTVDQARDRFEDQLDGKVKNGVVRSATGEVNVKATLDDFQQEIKKLKERYTDKYAASAEVEAVLRRATGIDTMMKGQPTGLKGSSEWDRLSSELGRLAAVYGTAFPLPEGASVRRISDGEAAGAAEAVAKQAEQLKRAVDSDKSMPKPAKDALKKDVEDLIKQAKLVKSRLSESKPATADGRALAEKVGALTKEGRQLPPPVLSAIGALRAPLEKLNTAFGTVPPPTQ